VKWQRVLAEIKAAADEAAGGGEGAAEADEKEKKGVSR